jgi:hypothetical protein
MDTVRIEFMIATGQGTIIQNWTTAEGSVMNDPQTYIPRAYQVKNMHNVSNIHHQKIARVRVVSEQTGRIVDIIQ